MKYFYLFLHITYNWIDTVWLLPFSQPVNLSLCYKILPIPNLWEISKFCSKLVSSDWDKYSSMNKHNSINKQTH